MVDEKLMLVVDDGKPLKKVDDLINTDSDSKVEEVFNETAETYNDDSYDDDDFDGGGLTEDQLKNANDFDMSLHCQLR
ncbi:hypothetical protein Tco_0532711 [Tanacetum coccineum]